MHRIQIIVIGASAGGVETLSSLIKWLPSDLPASIFVVIHFPENATSVLPQILSRLGGMRAENPTDGQSIEKGRIYVAPPGCHMLVKKGKIGVVQGPKENGHRPAIDPLFRSAARNYGPRVAAVILSGMLDDGVIGLTYVKAHGGLTMVQDPEEALFSDMPRHAIQEVDVDYIAPIPQIAEQLAEYACEEWDGEEVDLPEHEMDPTEMDVNELRNLESHGKASVYTCPECNGTLFELSENGMRYYRCRVGHSYTPETLEAHQSEELEAALWEALRALEENLALSRRLLEKAVQAHRNASSHYYSEKVKTGERRVELLRSVLAQTINTSISGNGPP